MSQDDQRIRPAIVKRLNRAAGQLRSAIDMVEENRACSDIAQQLQAVEKAIASARRELITDHIEQALARRGAGSGALMAAERLRALSRLL